MVAKTGRDVRIEPDVDMVLKALKAAVPERLDLALRKRFRELAADVRGAARANAAGSHPVALVRRTRRTQRTHWRDLVNSITSGSSTRGPTVSIGSDRVPWALGFEFGGMARRWPAWSGRGEGAGYILHAAVREKREALTAAMTEAVNEAMSEAFPE